MNFKEFLTKESVVIAALPVFGYVVAIAYEYGYAAYFGYPVALIVVDLRMTLTSMILGVLYIYFLLRMFDYVSVIASSEGNAAKFIKAMSSNYLMSGVFIFASGFSGPIFNFGIFIAVAFTVIHGVGVLVDARKMGLSIALDKLIKEEEPKAVSVKPRYNGQVLINLFHEYGFAVLIVLGIVFGAGRLVAISKNQFSYFEMNNEKYAVVAIYADSVIGAKVSAGGVSEDFSVISKSNEAMAKLGVLSLKQQVIKVSTKPVSIPY